MPTGNLSPEPDVPACDRCGRGAAFKDADALPVCEFCPAVDYGINWGRATAYAELAVAVLGACAATGTPTSRLHELVDAIGENPAVQLPLAPQSAPPEPMADGPWLKGLTAITGRGEAIIATRLGGAR